MNHRLLLIACLWAGHRISDQPWIHPQRCERCTCLIDWDDKGGWKLA
jgi:hypothetical protein